MILIHILRIWFVFYLKERGKGLLNFKLRKLVNLVSGSQIIEQS